ncbi:unnamed protein product [Trifolium pratense]|uniref:Uncharacterized protein n=1 Tax=Trifolium pratense TaxID=57577 RepID=A0ACB0INE3_TRIPR|nr:unnamed protein product [Trifolium pratense]
MSSQRNNNSGVGNNTTRLTDRFTSGTGSTDSDKPLKAYVTVVQERIEGNTNNETWTCNYCGGTYKGSYSRVKHHLLREKKKGIAICTKVTDEYEAEMRELETIATEKAQRVQVPFPNGTTSLNPPIDTSKRRRGIDGPLAKAFNNEAGDHLSAEMLGYFILLVCPSMLPKILTSSVHSLMQQILLSQAIDGTTEYKDKHFIAKLILETISDVGAQNVVQIITDNAPVCKGAGSIVEGMYPHIFLSPCVVHTLNLALRNICAPKPDDEDVYSECNWIALIAADAKFIKKFITNHSMRFAMFKKFVDLSFLSISETRFASIIVMLKRFKTIKKGRMSLVINEEWSHYKEDDVHTAASVKETMLNDEWWDKVDYILKFTVPIYDMLRSCDTDESNLHLVYEKWDSMIEQVKLAIYKHENKEYYCRQWLDQSPNRVAPHRDNEICTGRKHCLRNYFADARERLEATTEFVKFSSAEGELGQFDSLQDRWNLTPKEWWITYGSSVPKLQSIALKLLSQPSSSSCAERNWSTYSFIHSLKRNRLNPKRAEDLVFVHTNLRLLSRNNKNYKEGETKMWDIYGDEWNMSDGVGLLEVASLSLDEPDLEAVLFDDADDEDTV